MKESQGGIEGTRPNVSRRSLVISRWAVRSSFVDWRSLVVGRWSLGCRLSGHQLLVVGRRSSVVIGVPEGTRTGQSDGALLDLSLRRVQGSQLDAAVEMGGGASRQLQNDKGWSLAQKVSALAQVVALRNDTGLRCER